MPSSFTDMIGLRVACDNSCLRWRSSAPSVSTSSACTKEWIPQLPTVASYSESLASIAEFERELIRDRVRLGLAAARAKGKRIGRPRVPVDALRIGFLRHQGRAWAQMKADTGISKGTAQRALASLPRTPVATAPPSA